MEGPIRWRKRYTKRRLVRRWPRAKMLPWQTLRAPTPGQQVAINHVEHERDRLLDRTQNAYNRAGMLSAIHIGTIVAITVLAKEGFVPWLLGITFITTIIALGFALLAAKPRRRRAVKRINFAAEGMLVATEKFYRRRGFLADVVRERLDDRTLQLEVATYLTIANGVLICAAGIPMFWRLVFQ